MRLIETIYTESNSFYSKKNPSWHMEDSPWKANQILRMIHKNHLHPKTIAEVGCGAGEILNQLYKLMPDNIGFFGYDISGDALLLCEQRVNERIRFEQKSLFNIEKKFDLLLMIDVFEHVEDYYEFLKASSDKGEFKIFHIPLEITVLGVLRNTFMNSRKSVGHIHYFSKETALSTLRDSGFEILDHFYTAGLDLESSKKTFMSKLALLPRKFFYNINHDFGVRLLGGYSLMVLAK
ncbi:MAG: class I SAM-dependent methyltransferase [Bacteroidales bacterium]